MKLEDVRFKTQKGAESATRHHRCLIYVDSRNARLLSQLLDAMPSPMALSVSEKACWKLAGI